MEPDFCAMLSMLVFWGARPRDRCLKWRPAYKARWPAYTEELLKVNVLVLSCARKDTPRFFFLLGGVVSSGYINQEKTIEYVNWIE